MISSETVSFRSSRAHFSLQGDVRSFASATAHLDSDMRELVLLPILLFHTAGAYSIYAEPLSLTQPNEVRGNISSFVYWLLLFLMFLL